ncbi:MAG: bifunctional UDP-N-acetylmuramoyl-tripeptide:D-alanyl-D-alanine ligase/alanine racemase [Cyclobacteriaceae bacterium]|nr:bifunctional UDP-N-acetylmuramoyl-tripeptide:D-alanyl-D-alanine ligase/alanine racemase [Cyclobacteriaceae bacterium]
MMLFSDLKKICEGKPQAIFHDKPVTDLVTDSRKIVLTEGAVFFAMHGERHDAHVFLNDLYAQGIRQFVVERAVDLALMPEANVLLVKSSLKALQEIVKYHRNQFIVPVIGITGSNGKTIIKEWLYQLLSPDYKIVKNPGSYNSRLGVPLSVWQMQAYHELGIFEAGISKPGEMEILAELIRPTIGLLTNIGTAHDEGFDSLDQKIEEKLKLFAQAETIVYCSDNSQVSDAVAKLKSKKISWAFTAEAGYKAELQTRLLTLRNKTGTYTFELPVTDKASVENLVHCLVVMLELGLQPGVIQQRINTLRAVPMRLELKQGTNNCQLIDDSYNNDLAGLQISLDFLNSIRKPGKTLVLSDILQSGMEDEQLANRMAALIRQRGVGRLVGIGKLFVQYQHIFKDTVAHSYFFETTSKALQDHALWNGLRDEVVLLKGARVFQFEKIVSLLQRKVHGTRMEIDLGRLVHNLNFFKSKLKPGVKIMAMVKAFAYGSGSEEVANLLQFHRVDYLSVAYADEGIALRKSQVTVPIMVMNAAEESFHALLMHNLEPVLYSVGMIKALAGFLQGNRCRIHIELETGMHRLGLEPPGYAEAIEILKANPNLEVTSIFSHLAAADGSAHDAYTRHQVSVFNAGYKKFSEALGVNPVRHMLNSPGIIRFTEYQMDMVRLGIGLYGINPTTEPNQDLKPAATLKTVISQVKEIKPGDTVGYGRWGKAEAGKTIATIAIGYADGFNRAFSNGKGKVLVNGKTAPVMGNVCMDMTMIDITGIDAREGDEVIIFGDALPIQQVAESIGTIPYEILTSTSERVKRVFYTESI